MTSAHLIEQYEADMAAAEATVHARQGACHWGIAISAEESDARQAVYEAEIDRLVREELGCELDLQIDRRTDAGLRVLYDHSQAERVEELSGRAWQIACEAEVSR